VEAIADGFAAEPDSQKKYLSIILDKTRNLESMVGELIEFVRGADFGGRVVSCAGPWRIAAAQAHPGAGNDARPRTPGAARDYYDAALEDGGVYRLLCDLDSGEWYVDGIYD